jgi:phosphoglycolate phosphatase-like HAD superfamily hydrolase
MPLDLLRIKALCFDVDGTLHDTDDQFVLQLSGWLRPVKFLLPRQDPLPLSRKLVMLTETPATYLYGIPDRLGLDGKLAALGNWLYQKGLGKTAHPFRLIEGVKEMLELLQPHYPLSVVSARDERTTLQFLEQFAIRDFFKVIVTAQTCRHTKPYPDPILWAAEKMGVEAASCLMIGDTTVDILAGKAAQAQTVGVLCGLGMEDELVRSGADLVLPTTPKLVATLLQNH